MQRLQVVVNSIADEKTLHDFRISSFLQFLFAEIRTAVASTAIKLTLAIHRKAHNDHSHQFASDHHRGGGFIIVIMASQSVTRTRFLTTADNLLGYLYRLPNMFYFAEHELKSAVSYDAPPACEE